MKNGILSPTDVNPQRSIIEIDSEHMPIFEDFIGKTVKVIDENGCKFTFRVMLYGEKNAPYLQGTKDFTEKWNLKSGDKICFYKDKETGEIKVHIS